MKIRLSMPSTISSAVSVARLIQDVSGRLEGRSCRPLSVSVQRRARSRSMARRSALVGRPAPAFPYAAQRVRCPVGFPLPPGPGAGGARSSYNVCASAAGPRRTPNARTSTTRIPAALRKGQHVAAPDPVVRLGDRVAVHPQFTAVAQLARQGPGLEEAGVPQPLVDARPDVVPARLRRRSANPASALSGSP